MREYCRHRGTARMSSDSVDRAAQIARAAPRHRRFFPERCRGWNLPSRLVKGYRHSGGLDSLPDESRDLRSSRQVTGPAPRTRAGSRSDFPVRRTPRHRLSGKTRRCGACRCEIAAALRGQCPPSRRNERRRDRRHGLRRLATTPG